MRTTEITSNGAISARTRQCAKARQSGKTGSGGPERMRSQKRWMLQTTRQVGSGPGAALSRKRAMEAKTASELRQFNRPVKNHLQPPRTVPTFCEMKRLVHMYMQSETISVLFSWHVVNIDGKIPLSPGGVRVGLTVNGHFSPPHD